MQKHRKYLVITIWISTIAFVGAGFVGWGAYKFGSHGDSVAKVGDTDISIKAFAQKQNEIYNYYNKMYGGQLDQEKAKQLGINKIALQSLIQQTLLLNYAKDLGLRVSDDEVAAYIQQMDVFQNSGQFDKELYLKILKQNRLRPKDFEESIKTTLLLKKLQNALKPTLYPIEYNTTASALYIGDKIEYKLLDANDINISVTPQMVQKYYEEHKRDYLSPKIYRFNKQVVFPKKEGISEKELQEYYNSHKLRYVGKNGKILPFEKIKERVLADVALKKSKKEAFQTYLAIKKGKLQPQSEVNLTQENLPAKIERAKLEKNKTFKPFIEGDHYAIYKLLQIVPPKPLPLEKVQSRVKKDLLYSLKTKKLFALAKKEVKNFQGIKTSDYICRDDAEKLQLDKIVAMEFLKNLFLSTKPQGYIQVSPTQVVLYRILDQKLQMPHKWDKNKAYISDNGLQLKSYLINANILRKLEKLYPITVYKGL